MTIKELAIYTFFTVGVFAATFMVLMGLSAPLLIALLGSCVNALVMSVVILRDIFA